MSAIALKLPNNYVDIDREEMEYLDGGAVTEYAFTGSKGSNWALGMAGAWYALAAGYGLTAALAAAPTLGAGTIIAGLGSTYCTWVAGMYMSAYNDSQDFVYDYGKSKVYKIRVTTAFGQITRVQFKG